MAAGIPSLALPFAHLNLRRNPFGEIDAAERARLAVVDTAPLVEALRRPRGTVQVVGDCGRGKTTHLLALRRALPAAAFVRVREGEPADLPVAPVLLVDEAQHLPRRERKALFASGAALALGTHEDLSRELRAAGREPVTVLLRGPGEERLRAIVERRIEAARRGPGPVPRVGPAALRALLARHGDDLRSMEATLYESFQALPEVRDVEV